MFVTPLRMLCSMRPATYGKQPPECGSRMSSFGYLSRSPLMMNFAAVVAVARKAIGHDDRCRRIVERALDGGNLENLADHGHIERAIAERRVAVLTAERERRIARQGAHPEEHEHARDQQDDQGGSDLA